MSQVQRLCGLMCRRAASYSMVGRYLGDEAASLLDEEFKAALEVTDHRVGYNTTGASWSEMPLELGAAQPS